MVLPATGTAVAQSKAASASKQTALSDRLRRLGFASASRMRLYGEEFELVSDPIITEDNGVCVDAIEKKSRRPRRVRIPITIMNMAGGERAA
ncbi:MAG TPA: hypothetical protein VMD99_18150 [Terriglobales bacterium]|jgi:hypothetical protein|nr:hypothetical protein [Terriglobales bacterium]